MKHFPLLDKMYVEEAFAGDYTHMVNQYTEESKRVPESSHAITSFSETKFVRDLAEHFNTKISDEFATGYAEVIKAAYMRVSPNHGIDWHRDISRNCAINILLNDVDGKYVTLFRNKDKNNRVLQENWALDYELYRPVLINTQVEHMVANWSTKDRYLLTIGLPKNVSFQEAKEFLEKYVPQQQFEK
jgi:hypothetical protein